MLTFRKDNIFVGYGRNLHCSNCNNTVWERVYQTHNSSGMFSVQYRNFYGDLFCACPICNYGIKIKKGEADKLAPLMAAGGSETKKFFKTLSARGKRNFIKRLDKLKQKDLIVFLS